MHIKMSLYSSAEFAAAAAFCTALAEARRTREIAMKGEGPFGIDTLRSSLWKNIHDTVVDEPAQAAENAEVEQVMGEPVETASTAEPPKRRGRPRKDVAVDTAAQEGSGDVRAELGIAEKLAGVRSGQIDIEDVLGQDVSPPVEENGGEVIVDVPVVMPPPIDDAVGYTEHDARNAGRALLARAPNVETGNRKLADLLKPFGVQQVKALKLDQIEPFILSTITGEAF